MFYKGILRGKLKAGKSVIKLCPGGVCCHCDLALLGKLFLNVTQLKCQVSCQVGCQL